MGFGTKRKTAQVSTAQPKKKTFTQKSLKERYAEQKLAENSTESILKNKPEFKVPDDFIKSPSDRRNFNYYKQMLNDMFKRKNTYRILNLDNNETDQKVFQQKYTQQNSGIIRKSAELKPDGSFQYEIEILGNLNPKMDLQKDREYFKNKFLPKLTSNIAIINEDNELHKELINCIINLPFEIENNGIFEEIGLFLIQLVHYKPSFKGKFKENSQHRLEVF